MIRHHGSLALRPFDARRITRIFSVKNAGADIYSAQINYGMLMRLTRM